jgi:hypothetical protein
MKAKPEDTNFSRYKEIITQLKRHGTQVNDEEKLKYMQRCRIHLKVIDTLAAFLAIGGVCIEYYLVLFTQTQILFYGHPKYTITSTYNSLCYINIVLTIILRIF